MIEIAIPLQFSADWAWLTAGWVLAYFWGYYGAFLLDVLQGKVILPDVHVQMVYLGEVKR